METTIRYVVQFGDPRDEDLGWMDCDLSRDGPVLETLRDGQMKLAVTEENDKHLGNGYRFRLVKRTQTDEVQEPRW